MLATDLKGKARVLELSHRAYNMDMYYHLLRTLEKTRHRPRFIVFPINMRSFSPQWYLRPNWQFRAEIELLVHYYSGHGLRRHYRKQKYQDGYEEIRVEFPLSEIRTIREFEVLRLNKHHPDVSPEERRRELFIYFYLYPIVEEHPLLTRLKEILQLSRTIDSQMILYITPINIEAALRNVGREFEHYFSKNLKRVKDVFCRERGRLLSNEEINNGDVLNDSAICLDYSKELGSDCFFHTESIDDHLNQKGRRFIARGIRDVVLKLLEKNQTVGTHA
jgi:hypothetical protein